MSDTPLAGELRALASKVLHRSHEAGLDGAYGELRDIADEVKALERRRQTAEATLDALDREWLAGEVHGRMTAILGNRITTLEHEMWAEDKATIAKYAAFVRALTQGSTIRVYGCSYTTEQGERRQSIALTEDQRKLLAAIPPEPDGEVRES